VSRRDRTGDAGDRKAAAPASDHEIDRLYQLPLPEFTAARNQLAKDLGGERGKEVKRLLKPTVVPWAVNQVYWQARPAWDRLLATGADLRDAQIAALEGREADVRAATDEHRKAVAAAVREAQRLAAAAGVHPDAEPLARMLEAISLARELPGAPGRFTEVAQPAGFEALAGFAALGGSQTAHTPPREPTTAAEGTGAGAAASGGGAEIIEHPAAGRARDRREAARAAHEAEEERRRAEAARREAEAAERARLAREAAERRRRQAEADRLRRELARATAAEEKARAALEDAESQVRAIKAQLEVLDAD
jgi:hypothetical protein